MHTSGTKFVSLASTLTLSAGLALILLGYVTVVSAPGSDKLRMTTNAADVSGCTAVGNIKLPDQTPQPQIAFRNQAVGFGGNTALVTLAVAGIPLEGVAYRCPLGPGAQ